MLMQQLGLGETEGSPLVCTGLCLKLHLILQLQLHSEQ